jgi:hypothetical protein
VGKRFLGRSRDVVRQTSRICMLMVVAIRTSRKIFIGTIETRDGRLAGALYAQGTFLGLEAKYVRSNTTMNDRRRSK